MKIYKPHPKITSCHLLDPSFFVRKREEQKAFIQRMLNDADYEKRYKIFDMAFTNILKMLEVEQKHLSQMKHPENVLPSAPMDFKAVVTVLENICIIGEVVLHFPEMSYRILDGGFPKWRAQVEFAKTIADQYTFVYDASTLEMLSLFNQEINADQRTEDFINPYATPEDSTATKTNKKQKKPKKAKKGPALQEL